MLSTLLLACSASITLASPLQQHARRDTVVARDPPPVAALALPMYRRSDFDTGLNKRQSGSPYRTSPNAAKAGFTGTYPFVNVTIDQQNFQLRVDTFLRTTSVFREGVHCDDFDYTTHLSKSECHFGPTFKGQPSGGYENDTHLDNIGLGGVYQYGPLGYADVTVAGTTVKQAKVAFVTEVNPDNWSDSLSGVLGLGTSTLTVALPGKYNDPNNNDRASANIYENNTFLADLYAQNPDMPKGFSVAFQRVAPSDHTPQDLGGSLAFGGTPPGFEFSDWFSVPVEKPFTLSAPDGNFEWVVGANAISFPGSESVPVNATAWSDIPGLSTDGTMIPIQVLTNAFFTLMPTAHVEVLAQAFNPPATLNNETGAWEVACSAKAPEFSLVFGDKKITMDPRDMISPPTRQPSGICLISVQTFSNDPPYYNLPVLGLSFLTSIGAYFDSSTADGAIAFAQSKY